MSRVVHQSSIVINGAEVRLKQPRSHVSELYIALL
jgi:hypothetical protein